MKNAQKEALKLKRFHEAELTEGFLSYVIEKARGSLFAEFLTERMLQFHARQEGTVRVSKFKTLNHHRYTNPYRMLDRVSQYLIKNIVTNEDAFIKKAWKIYLFRVFNEPRTWKLIDSKIGLNNIYDMHWKAKDVINVVNKFKNEGHKLFRPAYKRNTSTSFFRYLDVLKELGNPFWSELKDCDSLYDYYDRCLHLDGFGPFLSYQLALDFWYCGRTNSRLSFVVPGPGAKRGIQYVFGSHSMQEMINIIRVLTLFQSEWLPENWAPFTHNDVNYPLQLNDIQNVFCEFSKFFSAHVIGDTPKRKLNSKPEKLDIVVPPAIVL